MSTPFATVVVIAHNLETLLPPCLDSILTQGFRNLEVIVVDDCSTDDSLQVAQGYAKKDKRVRVVAHTRNRGSFQARLTGMQDAVAAAQNRPTEVRQYVMFVDGDDQLLPNCIERAVATATATDTGADVVHFGVMLKRGARIHNSPWLGPYPKPIAGKAVFRRIANEELSHSIWNKCFSIAVIKKSLTDTTIALSQRFRLTNATDYLLCLILFSHARHYQPLKEALYLYCTRSDSVTAGDRPYQIENCIAKYQPSYQFAQEYCSVNKIAFEQLRHLATTIPLALTCAVLDHFQKLGAFPVASGKPIVHHFTTIETAVQTYITHALKGQAVVVTMPKEAPLAERLVLGDLLGSAVFGEAAQLGSTVPGASSSPTASLDKLPLVSIMIPAYNAAETLAQSINSALEQPYPNKEILIINDGSTDNTREIAERFAKQHSIITVIDHPYNQGLLAARLTGFRHARGYYSMALDADDRLAPDIITAAVERATMCNADVVHFGTAIKDGLFQWAKPHFSILLKNEFQSHIIGNTVSHNVWGKLVKTSVWKKTAESPPLSYKYNLWEDLILWLVAMRHMERYAPLATIGYHYQQREQSMTGGDIRLSLPAYSTGLYQLTQFLWRYQAHYPLVLEQLETYKYIYTRMAQSMISGYLSLPCHVFEATQSNAQDKKRVLFLSDRHSEATLPDKTEVRGHQKLSLNRTQPYDAMQAILDFRPDLTVLDADVYTDTDVNRATILLMLYGSGSEVWLYANQIKAALPWLLYRSAYHSLLLENTIISGGALDKLLGDYINQAVTHNRNSVWKYAITSFARSNSSAALKQALWRRRQKP